DDGRADYAPALLALSERSGHLGNRRSVLAWARSAGRADLPVRQQRPPRLFARWRMGVFLVGRTLPWSCLGERSRPAGRTAALRTRRSLPAAWASHAAHGRATHRPADAAAFPASHRQ